MFNVLIYRLKCISLSSITREIIVLIAQNYRVFSIIYRPLRKTIV